MLSDIQMNLEKRGFWGRGAVTKEKNRIVSQGYLEVTFLYYIKYDILYRLLLKTIRLQNRYRVQKKLVYRLVCNDIISCDPSFRITNVPVRSLFVMLFNSLVKDAMRASGLYCGMRSQMTQKIDSFYYAEKSESFVTKMRFSVFDFAASTPFFAPFGTALTS